MNEVNLGGVLAGSLHPPFIVAEMSANHNGSLPRALAIIEAASDAGVQAVKFQTYTADSMTIKTDNPQFTIKGGLWDGATLYDLYDQACTPFEWHEALYQKTIELGMIPFSTPFDEYGVDFLEELNTPIYKVASFELTDLALVKKIAETGKPVIASTGMASLPEIESAYRILQKYGGGEIVLLHCVSGYPTPWDQVNLATIRDLKSHFDCVVGLSDHTLGSAVAVAAVANGASVIEKHLTLRREDGGVDSAFSIEPEELSILCRDTKIAWSAQGKVGYALKPSEKASVQFRRSIYFVRDMKRGDIITENDIRRIRPGYGLLPKEMENVIGRRVSQDIALGTATSWDLIERS